MLQEKELKKMGEDLDQEENNQLEVDIAEDFGEESDSSIPSHIEINDIEKTDYNEYYKFDAVIESIVNMFNITNETNDDFSNINDESNSSIIPNEDLNDNEANEDNLYPEINNFNDNDNPDERSVTTTNMMTLEYRLQEREKRWRIREIEYRERMMDIKERKVRLLELELKRKEDRLNAIDVYSDSSQESSSSEQLMNDLKRNGSLKRPIHEKPRKKKLSSEDD